MSTHARPLSPHLQVYRFQLTMLMSILHRATGVFLALGALAFVLWLLALAAGPESFAAAQAILASLPGRLALLAFSAALIYHLLNGIRHMSWDAGKGLDIPSVYRGGYAVWGLTVALTAGLWLLAGRGA